MIKVMLKDGTIGTLTADSINWQDASEFIGEIVRIITHNNNGMPVEVEGTLVEILKD